MKCEQIKKLLVAYLDGEVTPEERRRIELHLSTCQYCQEELNALTATRAELRQALRVKAGEVSPSPVLWEKLRQRIEATTSLSLWERYGAWLNSPLWRAVIPVVLVVVLAVGVLWGTGILPQFGGMAPPPAPAPAPTIPATVPPPVITQEPPPVITIPPAPTPTPTPAPTPVPAPSPAPGPTIYIKASASFDKQTYLLGEDITVEISFKNITSKPFQIDPFPPLIQIGHRGEVVRAFPPGEAVKTLEPDETVTYTLKWDQNNEQGQQVPYGNYYIKLGDIKLVDRTMSLSLSGTREFLILPAQGVMEKTIEVNQSQTVNDITITLERVELTATGMKVYAFNTPSGYSLPPGQPGPAPSFWVHAEAEYSIDGGTVSKTEPSGIRFLDNGIRHTWDNLDPVPSDAKELIFTVTQLNDWQGPWEFKITLQ